jgi:hypothetical protein
MTKLKGASGVETFADVLLPHIFQDVTPEKETVVLKVTAKTCKNNLKSDYILCRLSSNQLKGRRAMSTDKMQSRRLRI